MFLVLQGFINAFVFAGLAGFFRLAGSSGLFFAALLVLALLFALGGGVATQGNRRMLVGLWIALLLGVVALLIASGGFPGFFEGGTVVAVGLTYVLAGLFGTLMLPAKKMESGAIPPI